jgi:hypothetical protein
MHSIVLEPAGRLPASLSPACLFHAEGGGEEGPWERETGLA